MENNSKLSINTAIIKKLKTLKTILKDSCGIEELAIFGSVAKGNDRKDSDVAILKMKLQGGFDIIRAKSFLTEDTK